MKTRLTGLLTLVLIAALGAPPPAGAQNGPSEGIKVHGHWTIDVRNPDGTLVSHHEFENAIVPSGLTTLARILGGREAPGPWTITVTGQGGPCVHPQNGSPQACTLFESGAFGTPDSMSFNTLAVTSSSGIELSGSLTATASGSMDISTVETRLDRCGGTMTPSDCFAIAFFASSPRQFTSHTLATPIAVSSGQIVQVTVVISFS